MNLNRGLKIVVSANKL